MKTCAQAETCMWQFIAALFVIAEKVEATQRSLIFCMAKHSLWYIYTTEYYSATENNEPLVHTIMWLNMSCWIKEAGSETTGCVIAFTWHPGKGSCKDRKPICGYQEVEVREESCLQRAQRNFFCGDEILCYLDCGCGSMSLWKFAGLSAKKECIFLYVIHTYYCVY